MATIINEMLENIIGYTAADLASELGDAFFEAAKQGEDAMEAWRKRSMILSPMSCKGCSYRNIWKNASEAFSTDTKRMVRK